METNEQRDIRRLIEISERLIKELGEQIKINPCKSNCLPGNTDCPTNHARLLIGEALTVVYEISAYQLDEHRMWR